MDGITVARIVDSELASRGISKAEFYAQSGVSSATLSQWRTGKYALASLPSTQTTVEGGQMIMCVRKPTQI